MTKEERFAKAKELAKKLDAVNDLDFAYTEGDEDNLYEMVRQVTKKPPMMWEWKIYNRQQCYSIMFSKLFLAYLLSEIREGNILSTEYLETIKERHLEDFKKFYWDDSGYYIVSVLEDIIKKVIRADDTFLISEVDIDVSDVYNSGFEESSSEDDEEEDEIMAGCILRECPALRKVTNAGKIAERMPPVSYYAKYNYELEVCMVGISSGILYDIIKREKKFPTELGKSIVEKYGDVLKHTLEDDEIYWNLNWLFLDEEDKLVRYYEISGTDVFGDDCFYPTFFMDRLYKYCFSSIFSYLELQKEIKEYKKLYFND